MPAASQPQGLRQQPDASVRRASSAASQEGRLRGTHRPGQAWPPAGYSESSANNAAAIIERAAVKKAFQGLIQQTIPVRKIIERLAEGLNAMETKCFVHEGGVIYSRPLVNFTERRHYLELAAKYGGYYVDKQQIELTDQADDLPEDQLIKKAEALLAALKGEA